MRLQGRFALWFSLAALVPIGVAAVVTREVVSRSYRADFDQTRSSAEQNVRRELARLEAVVTSAVGAIATREHPVIGGYLQEMHNAGGDASPLAERRLREQAPPLMRGLGLEILTIVDRSDQVLAAPHNRALLGERVPEIAARAKESGGRAFYAIEQMVTGDRVTEVLVVQASAIAQDGPFEVAVSGGRAIVRDLVELARRPDRVDARVVTADGTVVIEPASQWNPAQGTVIQIGLHGLGEREIARVELAISNADLIQLKRQVTWIALGLAAGALLLTSLLGFFLARRIAGNLDRLVEGAHAASQGDLDHRVEVATRDEVGEVATAFNQMMEELRTSKERLVIAERIAAWQEIARRLAHEIKNPLTPIQMAMDTLRKTYNKKHPSFDEVFEESTSTVLEEADRLKRIVSEFAEFARLPKPSMGPCDLNEVVGATIALYEGSVDIRRSLAPSLPSIEADRGQLAQIALNLIENARDAVSSQGGPAGHISVATAVAPTADRVVLTIDDSGPGVPDELKDKVFTPYFTTKHGRGGTGLGLAIVHRMVSEHGGRIIVADAPAGGARFIIELPLGGENALAVSRSGTFIRGRS